MIEQALLNLAPGAEWSIGPEGITWLDKEISKPSQVEIDAEVSRLQAEFDSLAYARSRKDEYPDFAEQLDYIYHNGITKWKSDMIKPVKDKYPKG
jgi:hypothetical protein